MKGHLAIICCDFFFAAIRSNWSPSSKHTVSVSVKTFFVEKLVNISISQSGPRKLGIFSKQISFQYFLDFLLDLLPYMDLAMCSTKKIYLKKIKQADLPWKLLTNFKFSLLYHKFHNFFVETKKSVKFGKFWIRKAIPKKNPLTLGPPPHPFWTPFR